MEEAIDGILTFLNATKCLIESAEYIYSEQR